MEKESKFIPKPEIERDIVTIGLKGETETERMLSNFAHTPFELDGVHYESVEAFWQSIKFPEGSKDRVKTAGLVGGTAKKAGKLTRDREEIQYQGQTIEVGSPEHHELMKRAIRAKLERNPEALKLLLDTGEKQITHVLKTPDGRILPDSKTIPGAVFSQILMNLREEFRQQADEKKEITQKVALEIVEPRGDKKRMIGFEGTSREECQAYNRAIKSVLQKAGFNPFHQIGTSSFGEHEPGYHAWEIWKKATKKDLKALLPEIEQEARSILSK